MFPWFHPNFPFETLLLRTWSNHHKSKLVNLSVSGGIFLHRHSNKLFQAFSQKKTSFNHWYLHNFRLNSNPNFISKILENVVASRIQSHLSSNSLSSFHSAYRIFHSNESTLLKIHNGRHLCNGSWWEHFTHSSRLICCTWYTVDHSIILTRLQNWFGLDGLFLDWFSSHLPSCSQAVSINDSTFHLCILYSLLWCTPRFRTGSTPFNSLYNSSWLFDLKNPSNIICTLIRWWNPAVQCVHLFQVSFQRILPSF